MIGLAQLELVKTLMGFAALEPLDLAAESIVIDATDVRYIEAKRGETVIYGRPWTPYPRIATLSRGTRLVVRGRVESRDKNGCQGQPWYAVVPFGFVCSRRRRISFAAHITTSIMPPLCFK